MKKAAVLLLTIIAMLLLTGCGSTTDRTARMEDLALLRVMAVDGDGERVQVVAATGETDQQPALILQAEGDTVIGACLAIRGDGTAYPTFSHLNQVLVGERLALSGMGELLDSLERDRDLRLSSRVWLLRGKAVSVLDEESAGSVVDRLSMLEEMAGVGSNDQDRTAGDLIIALERSGATYAPALTVSEEGNLLSAGYGVLKDDRLVCWLEGDQSIGADLLLGITTDDVVEVNLPDGERGALRLNGVKSTVRGQFQQGVLTGVDISCEMTATQAQMPEGWGHSQQDARLLEQELEAWAEDCVLQAVAMMQSVRADALELGRKIGLSAPWRWESIRSQWEESFPNLNINVEATAKITR